MKEKLTKEELEKTNQMYDQITEIKQSILHDCIEYDYDADYLQLELIYDLAMREYFNLEIIKKNNYFRNEIKDWAEIIEMAIERKIIDYDEKGYFVKDIKDCSYYYCSETTTFPYEPAEESIDFTYDTIRIDYDDKKRFDLHIINNSLAELESFCNNNNLEFSEIEV